MASRSDTGAETVADKMVPASADPAEPPTKATEQDAEGGFTLDAPAWWEPIANQAPEVGALKSV